MSISIALVDFFERGPNRRARSLSTSTVFIGERGLCLSSLKRLRARVLLTCTILIDERGPHRHMQSDKARRQLFSKIGICIDVFDSVRFSGFINKIIRSINHDKEGNNSAVF